MSAMAFQPTQATPRDAQSDVTPECHPLARALARLHRRMSACRCGACSPGPDRRDLHSPRLFPPYVCSNASVSQETEMTMSECEEGERLSHGASSSRGRVSPLFGSPLFAAYIDVNTTRIVILI